MCAVSLTEETVYPKPLPQPAEVSLDLIYVINTDKLTCTLCVLSFSVHFVGDANAHVTERQRQHMLLME